MIRIEDYIPIVGQSSIDELRHIADKLNGKVMQLVNSTAVGGGVAEILTRIIPLFIQLGVNAKWDVIKGNERFFNITKRMHNALHGVKEKFKKKDFDFFVETNRQNAENMNFYGDMVFIHDPQPVALVEKRDHVKNKWAWRCHIDFTSPQKDVMEFLTGFIEKYDASVFSAPAFARQFKVPQVLISPSIDPLSDKNKDLPEETINSIVSGYGLDLERPIVTQISRFDYLKDPVGVIKVYKKVKKYTDCQLVLAGCRLV